MPSPETPVDWRTYWNERYEGEPSRYGQEPNEVVVQILDDVRPGRVLDVACGQGRNSVWLAQRGHDVTALDVSDVAIAQARSVAESRGVDMAFEVADFLRWDPPAHGFDLVLLSYFQLPLELRRPAHQKATAAVAPGGRVVLVAHHSDNLEHGCGGPVYPEVLFDESDLASDFAVLEIERNERVERRAAADGLAGTAIDIVFIGRRPDTQ